MLIAPKRLKTRTSNLADMLPWNVPTEFPKKIFSKGGVAIVTWSRKLHGVKC